MWSGMEIGVPHVPLSACVYTCMLYFGEYRLLEAACQDFQNLRPGSRNRNGSTSAAIVLIPARWLNRRSCHHQGGLTSALHVIQPRLGCMANHNSPREASAQ
jgi:hypothetical protein